jgi:hypothetical protein
MFVASGLTTLNAQTRINHVHFAKDKYDLTSTATSRIDSLLQGLPNGYRYQVKLTGHTDSDGSNEYNQDLSANRVNVVYRYMLDKGLDSTRIRKTFYGEEKPFVKNSDETRMSKNRRVEIEIRLRPLLPKVEESDSAKEENVDSIPTCHRDTTVILPKGTRITLSLCDFNRHRESILNSQEITTAREMLENGLSLYTDDGRALVTGGMIRIADESVVFEDSVWVELPLIDNFFNCLDSSWLAQMRLYRANRHGDWSVSDSLQVVNGAGGTAFRFGITRGGTFNCDALRGTPFRSVARAAGFIIAPIIWKIRIGQSTLRIKTPNGERIRDLSVTMNCSRCGQPDFVPRADIRYNKKRTKAKVLIADCCQSDSMLVGYKIQRQTTMRTEYVKDLRKRGSRKLRPICSEGWRLRNPRSYRQLARRNRINRKYVLPGVYSAR